MVVAQPGQVERWAKEWEMLLILFRVVDWPPVALSYPCVRRGQRD